MRLEAILAALALRYLDEHGGRAMVSRAEAQQVNVMLRARRAAFVDRKYDAESWTVRDPRVRAG